MIVTRVERLAVVGVDAAARPRAFAFTVEMAVTGTVDATTGMVVNLVDLKRALREHVVEPLQRGPLDGTAGAPQVACAEDLLREVWRRLDGRVAPARLARVRFGGEPGLNLETMADLGGKMDVTRIYEFAASHRLHAADLDDAQNRSVFGKCNNPNGHGHNYVLEVTLRGEPEPGREILAASQFDEIVGEAVVDRWDHRHLNADVPEFANVNPTAEEIARVAWRRLEAPFATAGEGRVRLERIKLRETARNHVEYAGEDE